MKKIKFLLLNSFMVLTILSFISFGDDNNNNGDGGSIVGA